MNANDFQSTGHRLRLAAAALAMLVIVAGCGLGETAAGDVQEGAASGDAVLLVMKDNVFEPAVLDLPAGAPVTIEVRNDGEMNHNFTIEALNVSTGPMEPGDVMTVTFTPPAGTTEFVCTWHPEMVGQITSQ
jgi:plastocyanin